MEDNAKGPENGGSDEPKKLSADDILGTNDMKTRIVVVPEWNGSVIVRALSGLERDAFEASLVSKGAKRELTTANIRARLCAIAIVDPSDPALKKRAFTDEQITALGQKSARALSRVYDVAAALSGVSNTDLDDLAGN